MSDDTILIWGAGAIGGTIGAYLARASIPVRLVDLMAEHVEAINRRGLSIKGPIDEFTVPVVAVTPESIAGTFRRVLLCVKGQDTATAVRALLPHLAENGYVVSLQNGLIEETIADIAGLERTITS